MLQEGVTRIGPQDQFEEPQIGIFFIFHLVSMFTHPAVNFIFQTVQGVQRKIFFLSCFPFQEPLTAVYYCRANIENMQHQIWNFAEDKNRISSLLASFSHIYTVRRNIYFNE